MSKSSWQPLHVNIRHNLWMHLNNKINEMLGIKVFKQIDYSFSENCSGYELYIILRYINLWTINYLIIKNRLDSFKVWSCWLVSP